MRQLQLVQQQRISQVKGWDQKKKKKMFSLVSVGMFNHLFIIFFAWLTMFIVKLDRQLIRKINRFDFNFRKQNTVKLQRDKYTCAQ